MKFTKYHALGNDYIVVDPKDLGRDITQHEINILCDRHYGFGADGILLGPLSSKNANFLLRIFNPDGSEAEKSGNGLRIFSRYLWDVNVVSHERFSIETKGGIVHSVVSEGGKQVSVGMGKVRFTHDAEGAPPLNAQTINVQDKAFTFYAANIGNPHCVIILDEISSSIAKAYGPLIENDVRFKHRTNVQFVKVIDRHTIQIEIWERGAGYTLASGSSSTAAAAVVFALGLCESTINVKMPGGVIIIELTEELNATMTGAVCKVGEGNLALEALDY